MITKLTRLVASWRTTAATLFVINATRIGATNLSVCRALDVVKRGRGRPRSSA